MGVTVVLGEMDVARVNPYRSGQGKPSVHLAWFAPHGQRRRSPNSGGGLEVGDGG